MKFKTAIGFDSKTRKERFATVEVTEAQAIAYLSAALQKLQYDEVRFLIKQEGWSYTECTPEQSK